MKSMTVTESIRNCDMIPDGCAVILGYSGGPDSQALLYALHELAEEKNLTIYPVHVNHLLRAEESERDQAFCEMIAEQLGLDIEVIRFDCEGAAERAGVTTEEAGRKTRYRLFDRRAHRLEKSGIPREKIRILTAHTSDDQVETILFRIIRGTGTDGLSGIERTRISENGYTVVRPLLDVSREEIMKYLEENGYDYVLDSSNEEPSYTRNRIRLELLPELKKYNSRIGDALLRLGRVTGQDRAYLKERAEQSLRLLTVNQTRTAVVLDAEGLAALPDPIKRRVILTALRNTGLTEDVSFSHFEEIEKLLASDNPSAALDLPHSYRALRRYTYLILGTGNAVVQGRILSEEKPGIKTESIARSIYRLGIPRLARSHILDYDKLEEAFGKGFEEKAELRTRQEGDFIRIPSGRKKIQDLFVDQKVPKQFRDQVWLYAIGSEVLFIPASEKLGVALRYSSQYVVTDSTKEVFCVEIDETL